MKRPDGGVGRSRTSRREGDHDARVGTRTRGDVLKVDGAPVFAVPRQVSRRDVHAEGRSGNFEAPPTF